MKATLLLTCVLLTCAHAAGCATTQQPVIAEYEPDTKFDGVAVFDLKPDAELSSACGAAECSVNLIDLGDLAQALVDSDAFKEVEIGGTDQDLGIAIGTSASTQSISVTTLLLWRGQQLGELSHTLPFSATHNARTEAKSSPMAQSVISHIVRDVAWQKIFTPERVHEVLQASDYEASLDAPTNAGTFRKYEVHKFFDPLLGVAIRYRHFDPDSGHIDVFVYPIRAADWADGREVLEEESRNVRRDLDRLKDQGVHQLVRLGEDELLHWGGTDLLRFEGELANSDFQPFDTSTYVFVSRDKLVKVRGTRPRNSPRAFDADGFVRELLQTLSVPPESHYMKEVREHWATTEPASQ